jgi:ketosteroid isomerase-like protein
MTSRRFIHILVLILGFALANVPLRAAGDQDAIRNVIESQLNAFAADDGEKAYSFAAPVVKMVFPQVDQFMAMVKRGYQPVYRNRDRFFGDVFQDGLGRPAMRVVLTGEDGKKYEAIYTMERQQDGSWKIAGCVILAIQSQEV